MGRIRGKRNRDNDRYTFARRDADQTGMVGAEPVEVTNDGVMLTSPSIDDDARLVSSEPRGPEAFDLVASVRAIIRKRTEPMIVRPCVSLPRAAQPLIGFHNTVKLRIGDPRPQRYIGVNIQTGTVLRAPCGERREVVSVRNAATLRSGSAFWLWNPERAFRFVHGELFLNIEMGRIFAKTPTNRWCERDMPKYARLYLETMTA